MTNKDGQKISTIQGGTPRLHIYMYTQHMYLIIHVRTHMYVRTVRMYGCTSIGQWNEKIMKLGQHFCSSQASTNTKSTHQLLGVLIPHNVNTSQMVIRLGLAISRARERERVQWLPTDHALLGAENES